MSNYPPGAKNDPRAPYNQPDHSHEHEWWPDEHNNPVIEDGAAIFHQVCGYAEGRYGEGWSCNETRNYRFEYSHLESPDGEEFDLPEIGEWDTVDGYVGEQVIQVEFGFRKDDPDTTIADINPDRDEGWVVLERDGWRLHFEA